MLGQPVNFNEATKKTLSGKSCIIMSAICSEVVVITMATFKGESDEQIPTVVSEQITKNAHVALRPRRRASMADGCSSNKSAVLLSFGFHRSPLITTIISSVIASSGFTS